MLLDGATPDATATTDNDAATFVFQIGSGVTAADELSVSIDATGSTALGIAGSGNVPDAMTSTSVAANHTGTIAVSQSGGTITFAGTATTGDVFKVKINGTEVSITTTHTTDQYADTVTGTAAQFKDAIEAANIAAVSVTQAAGVLTLNVGGGVNVSTTTLAQASISTIDSAIATINTQRAKLGAFSNRLDSTVSNLTNVSANL